MSKIVHVCEICGSDRVGRDAWAAWNAETQEWELGSIYDHAHCQQCDSETKLMQVTPAEAAALLEALETRAEPAARAAGWAPNADPLNTFIHAGERRYARETTWRELCEWKGIRVPAIGEA